MARQRRDALEERLARQARRWEVEPRASVPLPGGAPCIAISRQPGAGGEAIGRQVAEWLDYGFFGSQDLREIAADEELRGHLAQGLPAGLLEDIASRAADAFADRTFSTSDSLHDALRVLMTLEQRGMAVVVGLGAAYALEAERALRVLVMAPLAIRVEQTATLHGLPVDEASRRVRRLDDHRRDYLRLHFGVEPDDPSLYDLVVNTERLDRDGAARVLVEALRRRFVSLR